MCVPFSCIVKSDLTILVSDNIALHSHSEILRRAGLPQETSVNQYAKVEINPEDDDWSSDASGWKLKLDAHRAPEWWRDNLPEIDARVRDAAAKWQRKLLALTEWHVQAGEYLIVIAPRVTLLTMTGGYAQSFGNSRLTIQEMTDGFAWSFDSSQMTIQEMIGGHARSFGTSKTTIQKMTGGLALSGSISQMTIQEMIGGCAWSGDTSQMTIQEMTGGDASSNGGLLTVVNDARKGKL